LNCGYEVTNPADGDNSSCGYTEIMICRDCREIVEVLVEPNNEWKNILKDDAGKCPICHNDNLEPWDQVNMPCPKCK